MRIDVEGEACPFCVPAMERFDVGSPRVAVLRGMGSGGRVRSAQLTSGSSREDMSLAHELLAFAIDEGVTARTWRSTIAAHMLHGGALATLDDLLPLAWNLGLDVDRTSEVLGSRRYRAVLAEGCPFFRPIPRLAPTTSPVLRRCAGSGRS